MLQILVVLTLMDVKLQNLEMSNKIIICNITIKKKTKQE